MEIVLNSLPEEWNLVRQLLKERLSSLDFDILVDEMLLEREHLYTIMGIQCTGRSARYLDPAAKFIHWFDMYEFGGHENDEVDDILGDLIYVPTKYICTRFMF